MPQKLNAQEIFQRSTQRVNYYWEILCTLKRNSLVFIEIILLWYTFLPLGWKIPKCFSSTKQDIKEILMLLCAFWSMISRSLALIINFKDFCKFLLPMNSLFLLFIILEKNFACERRKLSATFNTRVVRFSVFVKEKKLWYC